MARLLPFIFLISVSCLFGLSWIIYDIDPDTAPLYIFGAFIILLFTSIWGILGLLLAFLKTRFSKRYNTSRHIYNSFKMAFFISSFFAITAALKILQLASLFNIILAILATSLFAVWSYLGKKS